MLSFRSIAFAAIAAGALAAGPAAAKDFCTFGVPGCNNTYGGIQQALDAASADMATPGAGPDRVLIGSGTWIGNFKLAADVTVEGVGQDTVLTQSVYGQANGYPFVLDVSGQNAVVRNLRIKLPAGNQPRGLALDAGAKAENVSIDGYSRSLVGRRRPDDSRKYASDTPMHVSPGSLIVRRTEASTENSVATYPSPADTAWSFAP